MEYNEQNQEHSQKPDMYQQAGSFNQPDVQMPAPPISAVLARLGLPQSQKSHASQSSVLRESSPSYQVHQFHHPEWPVRVSAIRKLETTGEPLPLNRLLTALEDDHEAVRAAAVRVLGGSRDEISLTPLLRALTDPSWQVRTAAVLALDRREERAPVDALVAALKDEDESVRATAAWVLGKRREHECIGPLVAALQDGSWSVREAVGRALAEMSGPVPLEPLLAARMDVDSAVRSAIEEALHRTHPEVITTPLLDTSQPVQGLVSEERDRREEEPRQLPVKPYNSKDKAWQTKTKRRFFSEKREVYQSQPIEKFVRPWQRDFSGKRFQFTRLIGGTLAVLMLIVVGLLFARTMPNKTSAGVSTFSHYDNPAGAVYQVAWSQNDTPLLAFTGIDHLISVWNPASEQIAWSYDWVSKHGFSQILAMTWAGNDLLITAREPDGQLHVVRLTRIGNMTGEQQIMVIPAQSAEVVLTAWSPDASRIAIVFNDGYTGIWDISKGPQKPVAEHEALVMGGTRAIVTTLAWSPDGKHITTANDTGKATDTKFIEVWDAVTGQSLPGRSYHVSYPVIALAWSGPVTDSSSKLAYVTSEGEIWLRYTNQNSRLYPLASADLKQLTKASLAWSRDGEQLAATTANGAIEVWHGFGVAPYTYAQHKGEISDISWSPDGKYVASADMDGSVRVWGMV